MDIGSLVDLDRYPLDQPATDGYAVAVEHARSGLRSMGCAVIKDLVRPEALRVLSDEIVERKPTSHFSRQMINPYFHTEVNEDFPLAHPVNTFIERSSGFIPGDSWESGCATDVLFRSPELVSFLLDEHLEAERQRVRSDALID